mmetsp:Transcript_45842/g.95577  ORF Transcript_45842/g.95577 Transcript_45842/m.95577 type:complete len:120 (+) Transcript_45842:1008-1367(+)
MRHECCRKGRRSRCEVLERATWKLEKIPGELCCSSHAWRALICYCNMPRTAENERLRCSGRVSISHKDLLKEQTRQLEARSSQRPAGTAGHAAKCEGYQMPLLLSCMERAHEMLTATNY